MARSIDSFKSSSNFTILPSLVDIFPVGNNTIPKETCSKPFKYFSSNPKYLAVAKTCLKCNTCSYEVTYNALSKLYVLARYKIAAKSLVAYVLEPFDFTIIHGVFIP